MTEIAAELLRGKAATLRAPEQEADDLGDDFLGSLLTAREKMTGKLIYTFEQVSYFTSIWRRPCIEYKRCLCSMSSWASY